MIEISQLGICSDYGQMIASFFMCVKLFVPLFSQARVTVTISCPYCQVATQPIAYLEAMA